MSKLMREMKVCEARIAELENRLSDERTKLEQLRNTHLARESRVAEEQQHKIQLKSQVAQVHCGRVRALLNLTQGDLAMFLDIPQPVISRFENGLEVKHRKFGLLCKVYALMDSLRDWKLVVKALDESGVLNDC